MYTDHTHQDWNKFLYTCLKKKDVQKLVETNYGLQAGMTDLVNQGIDSEKLCVFFVRLQRSVEKTLKEIYREEFQNPLYDPANAHLKDQFIEDKKIKDHNLEKFLKESRF